VVEPSARYGISDNRGDFLPLIQKAFPGVNWEKAYMEFRAAGEKAK
jgi:hypothetical protein